MENYETNIRTLHQAVAIFGYLNSALRPKRPNALHLPLYVTPHGLDSGAYPAGGRIAVDYRQGTLTYHPPEGAPLALALAEHTQFSLFETLLKALREGELAGFFASADGATLVEALADKLGKDSAAIRDDQPIAYDLSIGAHYADLQYKAFTGMARFRARLQGHLSPLIVWPTHMDISMLWFVQPDMDEHKAHLNFGFAPYTPDMYTMPYLYAYAYPYPDGFDPQTVALPSPAYWNTQGWTGAVLDYRALSAGGDVADLIEATCHAFYSALKPLVS